MTKISNSSSPDSFFQSQNAPKSVFGRGSAPDPTGVAYDAPPLPLVSWGGGYPSSFPSISTLSAFLRPRQHKFQTTPVVSDSETAYWQSYHTAHCRSFIASFELLFTLCHLRVKQKKIFHRPIKVRCVAAHSD